MARLQAIQSGDGILATDDVGNILYQIGTTVPTGAGYMVGALFVDKDASAGAQLFINEGTVDSASFKAIATLSAAQTVTGAKTFSGSSTFSGAVTTSSTVTATGASTLSDLIEVDFNPANRVYVRADFASKIYSAEVGDNWSLFNSVASANLDWVMSGSEKGSLGSEKAASPSTDGGCYLTAGKSATSGFAFIKPRLGSRLNKIKWNTNKAPRFRAVINPVTITQSQIVVGLYSNSSGPALFDTSSLSGSNRIEVILRSGDSNWRVKWAGSGTASSSQVISGAAAAANVIQDIEIRIDSSRIVTVLFDSVLVFTGTTPMAANKNLIPIIGIQARDDVYTHLGIYHVELSQDIQ